MLLRMEMKRAKSSCAVPTLAPAHLDVGVTSFDRTNILVGNDAPQEVHVVNGFFFFLLFLVLFLLRLLLLFLLVVAFFLFFFRFSCSSLLFFLFFTLLPFLNVVLELIIL